MACPFFYPIARFHDHTWAIPPRLPLGDPHTGECRAQVEAFAPDESTVRKFCNCGYGRGHCERLPTEAEADAVRFHVISNGTSLHIQYIFEKACWPVRHGLLDYAQAGTIEPLQDPILERQAIAFAQSYLRRVGHALACP